jgi:kynureninase
VALTHPTEAFRIKEALALRGVAVDFRQPAAIRFAPSPLYSSYRDIRAVVRHMREIIDTREYEKIPPQRRAIS